MLNLFYRLRVQLGQRAKLVLVVVLVVGANSLLTLERDIKTRTLIKRNTPGITNQYSSHQTWKLLTQEISMSRNLENNFGTSCCRTWRKIHKCEVPRGHLMDKKISELVPSGRHQPFHSGNQLWGPIIQTECLRLRKCNF